jgi:hypothetical protein
VREKERINVMKSKTLRVSALACTIVLVPASSNALTFNFSFTSPPSNLPTDPFPGTHSGTVTGTISGLLDNSTGPATSIIITSVPSSVPGFSNYDLTLPLAVPTNSQFIGINSFTVTNGAIDPLLSFFQNDSFACDPSPRCGLELVPLNNPRNRGFSFFSQQALVNDLPDPSTGGPIVYSLVEPTPTPVPGPIVGAGIPGLIASLGGLLVWWRRRNFKAVIPLTVSTFRL